MKVLVPDVVQTDYILTLATVEIVTGLMDSSDDKPTDPWKVTVETRSQDSDLPVPAETPLGYPSFDTLRPSERLDLFTDIQANNPNDPIELVLRRAGVDWGMYKSIIDESDYIKMLHIKCISRRLGPRLSKIYDKMGEGAEQGDPVMMKMVMATDPNKGPESVTHINQQLVNMSNSELLKELEHLQAEAKELGGD